MKILMLTDFFPPALGGVEVHVQRLSHALARRGHDVAVVTLRYDDSPPFERDNGVSIYRLRGTVQRTTRLHRSSQRQWAPPVPDPELVFALRRVVARERPEVVHGHDWLARSFLPLKRWSGAAFVVTLHYYTHACAKKTLVYRGTPCSGPGPAKCPLCAANHYGWVRGPGVVVGNWLGAAAERAAVDLFLPVSRATARGNGLDGSDVPYEVIPNFLQHDVDLVEDENAPFSCRLPERGFVLFVGDLRRDKGIHVLLDAYTGLIDAPPLLLIGKLWPDTPTSFPPNVFVEKNWPNRAVLAAWGKCLFGVVPSLWPEPFGIVLIEAMANGRPVVASHIGGIPEVVVDGETGLLAPPGDPAALRAAIARLLADSALRARMGAAARRRSEQYREEVVVPRIEEAYRATLARRQHAGSQDLSTHGG